jgi:hypothetical protein
MRWTTRAATAAIFLAGACTPGFAGPFGFDQGMTVEQVRALVGREAVTGQETDSGFGTILHLKTVPRPVPQFTGYDLLFSPTAGLVKIIAITDPIATASDGTGLRAQFDNTEKLISRGYGDPANVFDFLHAGSIWSETQDFMLGLNKKERELSVYWESAPGKPLKDQVNALELEADGLDGNTGALMFICEFTGWHAYLDQKKAKQAAAF